MGYTSEMWNTAVRAGPVVLGIVLFASVNGLRHWFKVHYTPSYFVLFPISLLDKDIAQLTGLGPFSPVENEAQRRKRKHQFLAKAVISAVLTFAVIPLAHGVTAALYARPTEFYVILIALLVWQTYAAYQSTTDNVRFARKPNVSAGGFMLFYVMYLACLGGFMHRGFVFAFPFFQAGDWQGFFAAAWTETFGVLIAAAVPTVMSALFALLVVDREII